MTQPPTNEQLAHSLDAVAGSMQQMRASLASGQLSLDPTAGQSLRDGFDRRA